MIFRISKPIAAQLLPSSHSSPKRFLALHLNALLQPSSTYSTTSGWKKKNQQTDRQNSSPSNGHTQPHEDPSSPPSYLLSSEELIQSKYSKLLKPDFPRPSEIPFQAKVANSVNLIGTVVMPVQFDASPDGKYWAATIILQHDFISSHSTRLLRIPIIFEGDLAHVAACHLKEKDYVYIAGKLSVDPPPNTLNCGESSFQVMVHEVNFVEDFYQPKKSLLQNNQEQLNSSENMTGDTYKRKESVKDDTFQKGESMKEDSYPKKGTNLTKDEECWRHLLKNSKQWRDYRELKHDGSVKPKHPDFKRKDNGDSLWITSAKPWALSGLEQLEFDVPFQKTNAPVKKMKQADDDSWNDLVENPDEWWDNRSNKKTAKHPDFRHKTTRTSLWLNDSPSWVISKLPPPQANQNDSS